jgi:hypothetical protein
MRNDEVGFQKRSEKLTTEDTEITEGTLQVGGNFTHRQGWPSEQFLSVGTGFLIEHLWVRR